LTWRWHKAIREDIVIIIFILTNAEF